MRTYPHKPNESFIKKQLADDLEDYQSGEPEIEKASAGRAANFFERRSDLAAEVAAIQYAFEEDWEGIKAWFNWASLGARKAAEFGLTIGPDLYMTFLGIAILGGDAEFRNQLQEFQRPRFTNPDMEPDEIFYLAAEAMRDLSAGYLDKAGQASSAGLGRMEAKKGPNRFAKDAVGPLLMLLNAITLHDEPKLSAAIQVRTEKYAAAYSKAAVRNYPSGLLDVTGLGILRLAGENSLNVVTESVYLPPELLATPGR